MLSISAILLLGLLAFANGANDVSKGIATLTGSGLTHIRRAIDWGTVWTIAGALAGAVIGIPLIHTFSSVISFGNPDLSLQAALSMAIAPSFWVLLSTRFGWPVSTSHAITGTLLGIGGVAMGWHSIAWGTTLGKIMLPLLVSPFIAIALAFTLFPALKWATAKIENYCLCLTPIPKIVPIGKQLAAKAVESTIPVIGTQERCRPALTHWSVTKDHLHWLSSGLVSFARGLNDTPKLVAIILPLLALSKMGFHVGLFVPAAIAMGVGSWIAGQQVTDVLGFRVTSMDPDQGFSANFITAFLVIVASRFGVPVSTTHVAASAIIGVGLTGDRGINRHKVMEMLLAWIVTVPAAALLGIGLFFILGGFLKTS